MSRLSALGMTIGVAMALTVAQAPVARPAQAQMESREGIQLQNQILELRHELEQMRQQGGGGGGGAYQGGGQAYEPPPVAAPGAPSDINAQLLNRVSQLEDQVRQLRGRIDEVDNARQQSEQDLAKQIGDLQFRLTGSAGTVPGAGQGAAAALAPSAGLLGRPAAPPPPPPVVARRTPEVALAAGNSALARRDYPAAEAAAREVLASGRGPRGTDAQFLLAQALAGERNFPAAAIAYDDAYRRSARGLRAPDSLLGLANSLTALGDKKAACQTLDKLRVEFPSPRPDLRGAIVAARGRAVCR